MSGPKFVARYVGRCICDERIEIGDDLIYDEDGFVVHYACANRREALIPPKPREVCPRCFMEKAANGECGCDL